MATRNQTGNIVSQAPKMPKRKWWQYLPFLNQGYADQLAKYQNQYNEYWWNKENEYNNPASQVARYKEAGLSPALMYGQGNPGNADSMHQAEANQQYGTVGMQGILDRMLSAKERLAQINNLEAETGIKKVQKSLLFEELNVKDIGKVDREIGGEIWEKISPRQASYLADMERKIADAKTASEKAELSEKLNNWFIAQMLSKFIPGVAGLVKLR
jgi:hypothetical protein